MFACVSTGSTDTKLYASYLQFPIALQQFLARVEAEITLATASMLTLTVLTSLSTQKKSAPSTTVSSSLCQHQAHLKRWPSPSLE